MARRGQTGCMVSCLINILRCLFKCSPGLLRHLKARGNATVIWVANEDEDFDELRERFGDSLDGIMTDYPTNLVTCAKK